MNEREVQRLKTRFVGSAMLSFFLVALFVGLLINIVNYVVTQREIDWSLQEIATKRDELDEETASGLQDGPTFGEALAPSYNHSTFYVLTYDEDGVETSFLVRGGNGYAQDAVRDGAKSLLSEGASRGRLGSFYYQVEEVEDGDRIVVLIDCFPTIYARIRLLLTSMAVGAAALLLAFALVIALSNKAIRPEIELSKRQMCFLTNVSHELKTPLAIIRSNAEMEELLEGKTDWTQSTIAQVDRMTGLIASLVTIFRHQELEGKMSATSQDITGIIRDTARDFRTMALRDGKAFELRLDDAVDARIEEGALRQLTTILLDNALKYCDEGGRIAIALTQGRRTDARARLVVENSYADGSSVDCARFFDRFYREDMSRNIDTGGFGIGLSIAQSLCDHCGGSIHATWNEGTISFTCLLP